MENTQLPVLYITTTHELESFCERAASSDVLAVDTEFLREKTYYPKLCLVQLATEDEIALVDPLAEGIDLSPLARLMMDEATEKVFHACGQDLEVLSHVLGVTPKPIFDTQVAAAFLGYGTQLGYASVIERYTKVRLAKEESLTDWSQRPLDERQLSYAADDVRYLPEVYRRMSDELIGKNRLGWVRPEFEALVQPGQYEHAPELAYLRLKKSGSLTRRQLAVAREVCAWREKSAARRDIPRRWVAADDLLVEICKRCPKNDRQLGRIRGSDRLSGRDAEAILSAVERGIATPEEELPASRRKQRPAPETESVVDLMYSLVRAVSDKSHIAPQLIASRDDLVELVEGRPSRVSEGWRDELVGELLGKLLSGEIGLTVKDSHVEIL